MYTNKISVLLFYFRLKKTWIYGIIYVIRRDIMDNSQVINEIRSKVDIVDVISEYIPLIQKGRNYFGICPFHDDNHPSMSVSREKQIYKCFSCGASGNVFNFLMDYEHITFQEALIKMSEKTGVKLGNIKIKKENTKYDEMYKVYDIANKYFQNNLKTKYGHLALEYLKNRNIDQDIIKEFEIGLSLDYKDDLVKLLLNKNINIELMNKIGLASGDHDTYIKRIIFPLYDLNGRVVAFSGRIYEKSNINKYLNTKETPIFKKGNLLYNYHRAKEYVRTSKSVIIMEGFMDVIRAYTIGVKNVVALMGTALTHEQAELIKRLSPTVILCFDGDDAGRHATLSVGEELLKLGVNDIKVIELKNNDDPDTFILKNGKEKFESLIENALNFSDYKINNLKRGVNFNSLEEKAEYINKVIIEISKEKDDIKREIILKNLEKEYEISYNTLEKRLLQLLDEMKVEEKKPLIIKQHDEKKYNKYQKAMYTFIYYMLVSDEAINIYDSSNVVFPEKTLRILATEISYYYEKYGNITIADFFTYLQEKKELLDTLNIILSFDYTDDIRKEDIMALVKVIREYNIAQEIKRLKGLMKEENDPLEKAKIADQVRKLKVGSVE